MQSPFDLFLLGTFGSLVAGLGTSVGALAVLGIRDLSARAESVLLSSAAGVMLAASFFSLLLPALESADAQFTGHSTGVLVVIAGVLAGAVALNAVHRYAPHEHFITGREGPDSTRIQRIWLFIIAITLHNFPEGMAVGVGFASGNAANGRALAAGIGLQNVPEGLAVAMSFAALGHSRIKSFLLATLTGLVEPIGGAIGSAAAWIAAPMMPLTLGFAAGAMLFVISGEIIPETHRAGHSRLATFSLIVGFVVMMFLDVSLA